MLFKYEEYECSAEVFTNEKGIVVQFFRTRPQPVEITDYMEVDAGYGYIKLRRIGADGTISGLLKKEFFASSGMLDAAIDFVKGLVAGMDMAHIAYNVERIVVLDAQSYTGETFKDVQDE